MRNIPVNLSGFKLTITEAPAMKTRENEATGESEVVVNRFTNEVQYVVALFAKPLPRKDGKPAGKGEEIRVTLTADPGEGFEEGMRVELIDATVSAWAMGDRSGLSFRALGLKPAGERGLSSAA
ncbi:hypothetical protein [Amycolatopsis sacchari]|uniref:hypothetical protein n=1 Tax=Amycolatopsis sacchari TaxID=115433 RepID=UPI003D7060B2